MSATARGLSEITRFAVENGFRPYMMGSAITEETREAFVERLFTGLDARGVGLGPVKAAAFMDAIAHGDFWREVLISTAHPHQLASALINAVLMQSTGAAGLVFDDLAKNESTPGYFRMLREWIHDEHVDLLCRDENNTTRIAGENTLARVISEAMFGTYWRVACTRTAQCEWDVLCDDIRLLRPPFAPGVVRNDDVASPITLPAMEISL